MSQNIRLRPDDFNEEDKIFMKRLRSDATRRGYVYGTICAIPTYYIFTLKKLSTPVKIGGTCLAACLGTMAGAASYLHRHFVPEAKRQLSEDSILRQMAEGKITPQNSMHHQIPGSTEPTTDSTSNDEIIGTPTTYADMRRKHRLDEIANNATQVKNSPNKPTVINQTNSGNTNKWQNLNVDNLIPKSNDTGISSYSNDKVDDNDIPTEAENCTSDMNIQYNKYGDPIFK